jgi:hypothetical protein
MLIGTYAAGRNLATNLRAGLRSGQTKSINTIQAFPQEQRTRFVERRTEYLLRERSLYLRFAIPKDLSSRAAARDLLFLRIRTISMDGIQSTAGGRD